VLHDDTDIIPMTPGPLVLVVDDEVASRAAVTRMLQELGYHARSCSSGRAALRFLDAYPGEARILLADLGMPGMDGGELAERALDLDPGLAVVLMAGPDDAETRELLSGYRDVPFLWKPIDLPALARKVRDLVGAAGPAPGYSRPASPRTRSRWRSSNHHEV
jgi:two-component system cell cycle sensor histidine kinase/response regulator CckA